MAVVEDVKFVGDLMLLGRHIVGLNGTSNTLVHSYVLGLRPFWDDGRRAGGIGGLAWVTLHTASGSASGTHFVCYDGNGNVVSLISATTGDVSACYEYGPFGEPIRLTGPAASLNPFRFSTKRTDNITDLVLYEYRAYNPIIGCWLSRDPIFDYGARFWAGDNRLAALVRLFALLGVPFEPAKQSLLYSFLSNDPTDFYDVLGLSGAGTSSFGTPKAGCCSGEPCKITNFKITADVTKKTWIHAKAGYEAENCKDVTLFWWTCTWASWRQANEIDEDFKGSVMVVIYAALKFKSCENGVWVSKSTQAENKCHCFLQEAGRKEGYCVCDLKPVPGGPFDRFPND